MAKTQRSEAAGASGQLRVDGHDGLVLRSVQRLLRPGVALALRTRFRVKVALVLVVLTIPLVWLAFETASHWAANLATLQQQRQGAQVLRSVAAFSSALHSHRMRTSAQQLQLGDAASLEAAAAQLRAATLQLLDAAKSQPTWALVEPLHALSQAVQTYLEASPQTPAVYGALVRDTRLLSALVADASQLSISDDPRIYYLQDLLVERLASATNQMAAMSLVVATPALGGVSGCWRPWRSFNFRPWRNVLPFCRGRSSPRPRAGCRCAQRWKKWWHTR